MTNERPDCPSLFQLALRAMLIIASVLIASVVVVIGGLLLFSPGTSPPLLDQNGKLVAGSISEKLHVHINGIDQGMFLRGKDSTNPVLLFLHGGPGMPEFAFSQGYPAVLEDFFIVCWWEQRGSGLSFNNDIPPETLTEEQLVADTLAVTNYLRARFSQEKIYLVAHWGGSFVGIWAAAQAPELYRAYIGVGQITRQLASEKLAYT